MEALWDEKSSEDPAEPRWSRVILISLFFHLLIFSLIFLVPESAPYRRFGGVVYEVSLVEMPAGAKMSDMGGARPKSEQVSPSSKKAIRVQRISPPKTKKRPIVIAKRTVDGKKKRKQEKPRVSSSRLIDRAVSKVERKVKAEMNDPIAQAISKLGPRTEGVTGAGSIAGDGSDPGITFRIYQMEVESQIKGNWTYPIAIANPKTQKDLEAIVVLEVRNDGTILKSWVKKRSSDPIFDESVLKAIERSNPLPPFPEGYLKSHDEIEINFNLRELEAS